MRSTIKPTAIAAFLASITLVCPAIANATPEDDQFLGDVASLGITVPADQLIPFARTMCDSSPGLGAVGAQYGLMGQTGLSPQQTFYVANAGYKAYCPDKAVVIPPFMLPPGS